MNQASNVHGKVGIPIVAMERACRKVGFRIIVVVEQACNVHGWMRVFGGGVVGERETVERRRVGRAAKSNMMVGMNKRVLRGASAVGGTEEIGLIRMLDGEIF
jgi:hypothetical protein